ncbi:MAG: CcmL [Devosia sp.]|nr:CcmL [Devosia sp.]
MKRLLLVILLAVIALPAFAVSPSEILGDPVLEARAREISGELRCLVCQNQSIDMSDADLAHDLRVLVRERLTAGDSNQQVLDYIVARYGEFVLLTPVFALHTVMLWIAAPAFLLIGIGLAILGNRRNRGRLATGELSAEEAAALERLTAGTDAPQ